MEFSIWAYLFSSFLGAACYEVTTMLWKDGRRLRIGLWLLVPIAIVSVLLSAGSLFFSMDCINTMTPNPVVAWLIFLVTFVVFTAVIEYALNKWRN